MDVELVRAPRCPFCGAPGDLSVTCPTCGEGHHEECWAAAGGCANGRCESRLSRVDTPPRGLPTVVDAVVVDEGDDDPGRRVPLWAWIVGAVVLLAVVGVVLWLTVLSPEPVPEPTPTPTPTPTIVPVVVPQVIGLDFETARSELQALGLQVLFEDRVSDVEPPGTVLDQSLPPLAEAVPGDGIALVVAESPPEPTGTPDAALPAGEGAGTPAAQPPTPTPTPTPTGSGGPALDPPFVAIVESPGDRARAEAFVEEYESRGYEPQVLASDDYPQWQPGVFVVYVEQFADRPAAIAYCEEEFERYPEDCYVLDTRAR